NLMKINGVYPMLKKLSSRMLQIVMVSFIMIHFFTSFYQLPFLEQFLSVIALLLFICSIFYVSINKFKLPLIIFVVAFIILILTDGSIINDMLEGFLVMRGIVSFIAFIPLISWVLREEPYIEDMISLFYKFVNTSRKFYFGLVTFT